MLNAKNIDIKNNHFGFLHLTFMAILKFGNESKSLLYPFLASRAYFFISFFDSMFSVFIFKINVHVQLIIITTRLFIAVLLRFDWFFFICLLLCSEHEYWNELLIIISVSVLDFLTSIYILGIVLPYIENKF